MVFDCFQQVSHLSEAFTLEPGDVIATGTPAGVGLGRQPIRENLLHVGDTVRVEIEGIGELVNTVVEEPDGFLAGAGSVEDQLDAVAVAGVAGKAPVEHHSWPSSSSARAR